MSRYPKPLSDALRCGPLETEEQAKAWIHELHANGQLFHFDDPPEEVLHVDNPMGECPRCFLDEDVPTVRARVAELFDFEFDPFEVALTLVDVPPRED